MLSIVLWASLRLEIRLEMDRFGVGLRSGASSSRCGVSDCREFFLLRFGEGVPRPPWPRLMALDARRTVCGWGERAAFWFWWGVLAVEAGCDGRRSLGVLAGPGEDAVEAREDWRGRGLGCGSLRGVEDVSLP